MREIKFRGFWYSADGKLNSVIGDLTVVKNSKKRNCFPKLNINGEITKDGDAFISNSSGSPYAYKVIADTVGQFTGLKDKNCKEIYEGDIVERSDASYYYIVLFLNGCWSLKSILNKKGRALARNFRMPENQERPISSYNLELETWRQEDLTIFVVIGNIHDNPELLESVGK